MTKNEMLSSVASTAEILADFRAGKMVILIDDEDRENEGDLLIAADFVTPEAINFMARHARGLVCLTLTEERCRRLRLPLMTAVNGTKMSTNFTMSIEAAEGVTTGISAADRARTIQAAVAADAKPSNIVQPGHVFPVMTRPGGKECYSVRHLFYGNEALTLSLQRQCQQKLSVARIHHMYGQ